VKTVSSGRSKKDIKNIKELRKRKIKNEDVLFF